MTREELSEEMRKTIDEQRAEIARLTEINNDWQREFKTAVDGYNAIEKDCERLREALQALVDVQNWAPLAKYQREWTEAMQNALAALKETP